MRTMNYLKQVLLFSIFLFAMSCEKDEDKNEKAILSTGAATQVGTTTATLNATITSNGGSTITKRGFYWATHNNPGSGDTETVVSGTTPTFTSALSDLQPVTTYYYRAFATNSVGTAVGNVQSFTTTEMTVTDIDGNTYQTVQIGDQWWMAENLKVTKYANGTSIAHITDDSEWAALGDNNSDKAYCFYNNDAGLGYGALYTFAAATNGTPHSGSHVQGVCPDGWHLPSHSEWAQLEDYLIANGYNYDGTTTGNKIGKALASQTGWDSSNEVGAVGNSPDANNSSGFNALPGGNRYDGGSFYYAGSDGHWWSSTQYDSRSRYAYYCRMRADYSFFDLTTYGYKSTGVSVRCVRD